MTSNYTYGTKQYKYIDIESENTSPSGFASGRSDRANTLLAWVDALPNEPRLMPLNEDKRGPVIRGECRLDTEQARSYLVTPDEAARQIRENGVRGYYVYAGKESHNTGNLLITDEDEPEQWPDIRETLTVVSGSGTGLHRYWINDGWHAGSEGKDDLQGVGGVRVRNTGVVVPGSLHHETEGVYQLLDDHPPAPLAPSDLPEGLQPSNNSGGEHTYQDIDEPDETAVGTVSRAINGFRTHSETSRRAIEYFEDLRAGHNLREHGFIPDNSENQKGCRHEANLSLASKLQGMLLMDGESDRERNKRLIHHYLSWVAHQYEWTDMGQRRKLLVSDKYIRDTVNKAVETFDQGAFTKWMRKTKANNYTGNYSKITESVVLEAVELLVNTGDYPKKTEVVEMSHFLDNNPRSERTYGECLRQMVGGKVKMAHLGGNEYRYYPLGMDDPDGAESITGGGWM